MHEHGERGRRTRRWAVGAVVTVLVLVLLLAAGVLGAPWLARRAGLDPTALPWSDACSVAVPGGPVGLSPDEARRATTAMALAGREGARPPDTAGIDPAVLDRLREGPSGEPGPVLTCRSAAADDLKVQRAGESGLTPRAEKVRTAMAEVFGEQSLGGFEPGGVSQGHGERSAHYEGRAIDVFYRPVSAEHRRAGWLLAHWLVAHADELDVEYVIFDDRIWGGPFSAAGWREYTSNDTSNDILQHRDHVHVDVLRGS